MAFNLFSRVRETTTTTGTGAYTLAGAVAGHRAFNASGCYANGDSFFALIVAGSEWELIKGTWNTGGTVSRTQVYKSTNSNNAVNWGAGTKEIFVCPPAPSDLDAAGRALLNQAMESGGGGGYKDLRIDATTTIAVTATRFPLETTDNAVYMARDVNATCNQASSGANGLDTGTVSGTNWYYVWIIYNPTTGVVASLLSLSATAPTMPSGYTYKGLAGVILYTDDLLPSYQRGDRVAMNTGNLPGTTGAVDISAFVPPEAIEVWGAIRLVGLTSTDGESTVGGGMAGFQDAGGGRVFIPFSYPIQTPQEMTISTAGDAEYAIWGFRIPI